MESTLWIILFVVLNVNIWLSLWVWVQFSNRKIARLTSEIIALGREIRRMGTEDRQIREEEQRNGGAAADRERDNPND